MEPRYEAVVMDDRLRVYETATLDQKLNLPFTQDGSPFGKTGGYLATAERLIRERGWVRRDERGWFGAFADTPKAFALRVKPVGV